MADTRFNPEQIYTVLERQEKQIQRLQEQQKTLERQLQESTKNFLRSQINVFLDCAFNNIKGGEYLYHTMLQETLKCIVQQFSQHNININDVLDLFFADYNVGNYSRSKIHLIGYQSRFIKMPAFGSLIKMIWEELQSRKDYDDHISAYAHAEFRLLTLTKLTIGRKNYGTKVLSKLREAAKNGFFLMRKDFYDSVFDDNHSIAVLADYLYSDCIDEQTMHSNGKFIFDLLRNKQYSIFSEMLSRGPEEVEKFLEKMLNDKQSSIYKFMQQPLENRSIKEAREKYAELKGFTGPVVEMVAVSSGGVADADPQEEDELGVDAFYLVPHSIFVDSDDNAKKMGIILNMADATNTENARLCKIVQALAYMQKTIEKSSNEIDALKKSTGGNFRAKYIRVIAELLNALNVRKKLLMSDKNNESGLLSTTPQIDELIFAARKFHNVAFDLAAHHEFKLKLYAVLNPAIENGITLQQS